MIDNYDSFTFNLVHYFQSLGEEVLVKRNDEVTIEEIEILAPQYIVISPGPCDPNAAGISLNAIAHFVNKTPILGVCLGHQCIAQHFGGQVVKAKQVMHGKVSHIEHNKQGLFANLPQPLAVTRYHSLIVEKQSLPTELEITALTVDDEIMALKHKHYPVASVQFHPESILTEQGQQLLENFIKNYQHYPIS